MVVREITDEADAVGIVGPAAAAGVKAQRVGGARQGGALAGAVGDGECLLLEGQGHVEAAPPRFAKGGHRLGKAAGRDTDGLVAKPLPGLRRKGAVNVR